MTEVQQKLTTGETGGTAGKKAGRGAVSTRGLETGSGADGKAESTTGATPDCSTENRGKKRMVKKRDGAARLRRLMDERVAQLTEQLADVLTQKALGGDVNTARLMVALAEGGKPEKKKKKRPSLALAWAVAPEWVDPAEGEKATGTCALELAS
jgi:hypothetical protein